MHVKIRLGKGYKSHFNIIDFIPQGMTWKQEIAIPGIIVVKLGLQLGTVVSNKT